MDEIEKELRALCHKTSESGVCVGKFCSTCPLNTKDSFIEFIKSLRSY